MTTSALCMTRCPARPAKRTPHARVRRRVLAAAAAALLLATMVYGESWVLDSPATACVECAVTRTVASVLDGHSAEK